MKRAELRTYLKQCVRAAQQQQFEEADLEQAAPEEHHPREQQLE